MADKKEIVIIGDRVLIEPDSDKERTESGLYLPQGISEKEKVQGGHVAKTGPGLHCAQRRRFSGTVAQ